MATILKPSQTLKQIYHWYHNLRQPKTWCLADMHDGFVLAEGTFTEMMDLMCYNYDEMVMVVETHKLPKGYN